MNQLVQEIHEDAKAKGWWPTPENGQTVQKPSEEIRMLVVTEIAEATEAVRSKEPPVHQGHALATNRPGKTDEYITPGHMQWNALSKPEGESVELADAVIRILDYFGSRGWSIDHHLNDHVGLYESDNALVHHMQFVEFVSKARGVDEEKNLGRVVVLIKDYFETKGWDLEKVMRLKIDFNKTRSFRHGNKAH